MNPDTEFFRSFWKKLKACKLECEEIVELYDNIFRERTSDECQNQISRLLEQRARQPLKERFDALIVTDDTAMRGAAHALLKAGVDVPSDIRVLVQTNQGINHHYGLYIDRLELPVEEQVKAVVEVLEGRILAPSKVPRERVIHRVLKPSLLPR